MYRYVAPLAPLVPPESVLSASLTAVWSDLVWSELRAHEKCTRLHFTETRLEFLLDRGYSATWTPAQLSLLSDAIAKYSALKKTQRERQKEKEEREKVRKQTDQI